MASFDMFEHYKVDKFIYDVGLCVDGNFRNCGIATKLLNARKLLMQSINVPLTTTIFSTIGGQKAAEAANFAENFSMPYEQLEKIIQGSNFSHVYGTSCRIMSYKIQ